MTATGRQVAEILFRRAFDTVFPSNGRPNNVSARHSSLVTLFPLCDNLARDGSNGGAFASWNMGYTPRRTPRVTLPPRTREFNPLEAHSRRGGCRLWAVLVVVGFITGVIIAVVTWLIPPDLAPYISLGAEIATPTISAQSAINESNPTAELPVAMNPSATETATHTPRPTATNTRAVALAVPTMRIPTRVESTPAPIPTTRLLPTQTAATVTAPAARGDIQVLKIRYETDPPKEVYATKRTFTFFVVFLNPNPSDFAVIWGVALYRADKPNATNPLGQSSLIKMQIPPGVTEQKSGTYDLQSGGERVCFVTRVYQVKDDNPQAFFNGSGQNFSDCVGND